MAVDPLFSKMDALMKKHRGHVDASTATPAPGAWLPVLTDVVKHGTPAAPMVAPASPPSPGEAAKIEEARPEGHPGTYLESTAINDSLAEQLLNELAPKLSEVMEKQVAAELRRNLDETVSTLLAQLDVNVREIVREAVAEKLQNRTPPSGH